MIVESSVGRRQDSGWGYESCLTFTANWAPSRKACGAGPCAIREFSSLPVHCSPSSLHHSNVTCSVKESLQPWAPSPHTTYKQDHFPHLEMHIVTSVAVCPRDRQSPEGRGCVLFSWVSTKASTNLAGRGPPINIFGIPGCSASSLSNHMAVCLVPVT